MRGIVFFWGEVEGFIFCCFEVVLFFGFFFKVIGGLCDIFGVYREEVIVVKERRFLEYIYVVWRGKGKRSWMEMVLEEERI